MLFAIEWLHVLRALVANCRKSTMYHYGIFLSVVFFEVLSEFVLVLSSEYLILAVLSIECGITEPVWIRFNAIAKVVFWYDCSDWFKYDYADTMSSYIAL